MPAESGLEKGEKEKKEKGVETSVRKVSDSSLSFFLFFVCTAFPAAPGLFLSFYFAIIGPLGDEQKVEKERRKEKTDLQGAEKKTFSTLKEK